MREWMPRRRVLAAAAAAIVLASCGVPRTDAGDGGSENPWSTVDATVDDAWFDGVTAGADLVLGDFSCDDMARAAQGRVVLCAVAGTAERPFAVVVVEDAVDGAAAVPTVELSFRLYEPIRDAAGRVVRAVTVVHGAERFEPNSPMSPGSEIRLLRAPTAQGSAVAIHYERRGGSRLWNEFVVVGANRHGSPAPVATWSGEGVDEAADGAGLVLTSHHYGDGEAMCCASYVAFHHLHPGEDGWVVATRVVPRDEADGILAGLDAPEVAGAYEFPTYAAVDQEGADQ